MFRTPPRPTRSETPFPYTRRCRSQATVRALRRYFDGGDAFPQDVAELLRYFEPVGPGQPVQAVPGGGIEVPVWLLGSSLFSAQLAAAMGLPYAFASHFAPAAMEQADRKSVVEGKSVSVRVDLGGRRIIKKKHNSSNDKDSIYSKSHKTI